MPMVKIPHGLRTESNAVFSLTEGAESNTRNEDDASDTTGSVRDDAESVATIRAAIDQLVWRTVQLRVGPFLANPA